MNVDIDLIRQILQENRESILAWLVAGLVMLLLVRFELRRMVRRSVQAMSESVITTVATCVPEVALAVQAGGTAAADTAGPVEAQRADALRRLALDTVATVMARGRWLEDLGNLRLGEDALLQGRRAGGADPLLVVAPQPVVQAYLAAQRMFEDEAGTLQRARREAQRLQEALQALEAEAGQVEQETGSIVMRFEQVNAQAAQGVESGDYQRFLIQKYNALGLREKEIAQERKRLQGEAREAADLLARRAHDAARRYTAALAPLMQQLRAAWGHGDSPEIFDTWLRTAPLPPAQSGQSTPDATYPPPASDTRSAA